MINELQNQPDLANFMFDYYHSLNREVFADRRTLATMLMLRVFYNHPKRANSLETLGLVSVQYPALKQLTQVPQEWLKLELSLNEWRDFLKICLDFYVRGAFVSVPLDWKNWLGMTIHPRAILAQVTEFFFKTRCRTDKQLKTDQRLVFYRHCAGFLRMVRIIC